MPNEPTLRINKFCAVKNLAHFIKPMTDSGEKATWLAKPKKKKPAPAVGVARADGIVIKFKGTLQTATTQNGPWQDNEIAKSPLTVTTNGHGKFFRSR